MRRFVFLPVVALMVVVLSPTVLTARRRMMLTLFAASVVGMVALFGVGIRTAESQTATPKMQMQDLGTLGGNVSWAMGINDSGKVVGYSYTSDGAQHAFLYDESATPKMQDLGTLGGNESHAAGISASGQVVGYSYTSDGAQHAFLYDGTNGMQDLNNLLPAGSGWTITSASAINSDGKIAASGYGGNTPPDPDICPGSWTGPAYGAAIVLTPATTATFEVQDLGNLGGYYSRATGINDSGQVVGVSFTNPCIWDENAFLYDATAATPKMQNLGNLGGYYSRATGINDSGQVVGQADDPQYWELFHTCIDYDCERAFLYDGSAATPKMQNLGTLLGNYLPMGVYGSGAQDINDSGQVVGMSATQLREVAHHGFLYDESATPKMQDLNNLLPAGSGWTIRSASAINSNGKIAATGYKDGVGTHALLLTPTGDTPPPADTQAPSPPTISSPQNNTYDKVGSFSVSGSAEAGSSVELFEGTTSTGKTTKADSSSGAWSIALSGVSDGAHTYTAKAKDAAGNSSSASNSVTITVDKTPPTVTGVSPARNATKVARNTIVTGTFSEKMDLKTLVTIPKDLANPNVGTSTTFTLVKYGTTTPLISATVSYNDSTKKVTLTPSTNLAAKTKYTVKMTGGVKDLAGNALANAPYTWSFTTGS
jgi:probable HAF family extracellular repeat protein